MPSDELDRKLSEVSSSLVSAWIEGKKKDIRMEEFKPLITWPPGTEYLHKVSLPEQEPLGQRVVQQVLEVFHRHGLNPNQDKITQIVTETIDLLS